MSLRPRQPLSSSTRRFGQLASTETSVIDLHPLNQSSSSPSQPRSASISLTPVQKERSSVLSFLHRDKTDKSRSCLTDRTSSTERFSQSATQPMSVTPVCEMSKTLRALQCARVLISDRPLQSRRCSVCSEPQKDSGDTSLSRVQSRRCSSCRDSQPASAEVSVRPLQPLRSRVVSD